MGASWRVSKPPSDVGGVPPEALVQPSTVPARILVVDDEPAIATSIRRSLPGAEVSEVVTAAGAADAVSRDAYDLVLLDLGLPDAAGATLHARLIELDPAVEPRVVIMTGGAVSEADRVLVARLQGQVLEKPFGIDALRAMVGQVLATVGIRSHDLG